MQAGTESDDLDLYVFAQILVILRDIRRIVECEIHRSWFVGIHLQDKMMQLLVNGGLLHRLLRRLLLHHLRGRWRHGDEQRDENGCRCSERVPKFYHHMSPVIEFELTISCEAWQRLAAICMPRLPSLSPSSVRRAKNARLG